MELEYAAAQEELRQAFVDLARAKQDLLILGGHVKFEVRRNELYMEIDEGSTLSFPFVYPEGTFNNVPD